MNKITIYTSSVTYAIKAKKILERKGIDAALIKTDSTLNKEGCTYGVKLDYRYYYDAEILLKKYGIEHKVQIDI